MSLIQRIVTRRSEDIINQGLRLALTGTVGAVTDNIIAGDITERTVVVTGIMVSTTSATNLEVKIGFKTGTNATVYFFDGYIMQGAPLFMNYMFGDERYSQPGDALVITTTGAGPTIFTVNGRLIGEKVAIGYIEMPGASGHLSPASPPAMSGFSGLYRGGFPN